jgi:hypothetical protein
MNTSSKLLRPAAAVLALGGLCWVVKFVVIAATDGATSGVPDTVTGLLYISAVVLMSIGSAALVIALLAGRHPVLRALGGVVGLVGWWVVYLVVDAVSQAIAGDAGPSWLTDEIGIVVTGALLLTVGLLLARPSADREAVPA